MLSLSDSLLVIIGLFDVGLMLLVLRGKWPNPINLFFGIALGAIAAWAFALVGFHLAYPSAAVYFEKAAYAAMLLIGVSFYLFSSVFPEGERPPRHVLTAVGALIALALLTLLSPDGVAGGPRLLGASAASLREYLLFTAVFSALFIGGLVRIWRKYVRTKRPSRQQLLVIVSCIAIAGAGGMYYDLILALPFFAPPQYLWTGPLFVSLIAVIVMYAIFRLRLFNTRVMTTELLIATLCAASLLRTLLAVDPQERVLNAALFVLSFTVGSVLVRSAYKEVRTHEFIEKQEKDLEATNARLRELDTQKSEFLSFASHQLRTPLTAIKWNSGAILEGAFGQVPENLREPLQTIFDQSSLMAVLVDDYLNVSRIEQGRMRYQFASVNLTALLKNVAAEFEPSIMGKGLTLSTDLGEEPVMVWGDTTKLTQVFTNILDNAIKYTPRGHISIVLTRVPARGVAHVEMRDTGIGMDDETRRKVFDKFTRGDNATVLNSAGSGLGLFIVRTFVEVHRGKVWPESQGINKGTSFYVELPLSVHTQEGRHPALVSA